MLKTPKFIFSGWLVIASFAAAADEVNDREALLIEIEYLAETSFVGAAGIEIAAATLISEFYERRNFAPAWRALDQIDELLDEIRASRAEGLNPADYHLEAVEAGLEQLRADPEIASIERAVIELVLTDSLIRLGYHKLFGKVNPYSLDSNWNFRRELEFADPVGAIQDAIDSPSLAESLRALAPRGWLYHDLLAALADYRDIVAHGGWPRIPEGQNLRLGDSDWRVPVIAARLVVTGDLEPGQNPDAASTAYTDQLVAAVKLFQERHGIEVDGVIGPSTLRAMNVPAEQRVRQLELSLERARWVTNDLEDDLVLVNIAGFRAFMIRDREIVWERRVQVGTAYRQTPIFRDELKYLVFNPTWTVPHSIATKDLLPQIQRDPAYVVRNNFEVRDRSGAIVDPANVRWSNLSRNDFGYTLIQKPGADNALGRVKFMFPNEHAVYLHDTPSRTLFGRAERAFSSGCIRVENPFELAELLLGRDGWDQRRFQEVLDSGELTTIFLSESLPVLLLYWTASVGQDGKVYFFNDVYDRDAAVARALDEPFLLDLPGR